MSGACYGGDEVGALVIDVGCRTIRAGYAGEDIPKLDLPAVFGYFETDAQDTEVTPTEQPEKKAEVASKSRRFLIDRQYPPIDSLEIGSLMRDGQICEWDAFEGVLATVFGKSMLNCEPSEHPVLFSEPVWNARDKRERLAELAFERFRVPGFYLAKSPVLTAYASGKYTALVIDAGANLTSVCAVYDGYALERSCVRSQLAGQLLVDETRHYLENYNRDGSMGGTARNGVDLVPAVAVAQKQPVREGDEPSFVRRKNADRLTRSYYAYAQRALVEDFVASMLKVSDEPFNRESVEALPGERYEFPTGFHAEFGSERFRIAECLFDPTYIRHLNVPSALAVPNCVVNAVQQCDPDIRTTLLGSTIVVGGTSLLSGFTERLNRELVQRLPGAARLKMVSVSNSAERRFATWIGGSILASLGTFQQNWISKQEYEEHGKTLSTSAASKTCASVSLGARLVRSRVARSHT